MKICKVKITKKFQELGENVTRCDNVYPIGYNPKKMNVICYSRDTLKEGDNIGYCAALVEDDFAFNSEMVEINKEDAESFITDSADSIVDLELKNSFITNRKNWL